MEIKVGDELAFCEGLQGVWTIIPVEKISKSGRITCGRYVLNPDMSVRGVKGYHGPWKGEVVTPEIREIIRRKKALETILRANWSSMSTANLLVVVDIIEHGKKEFV